jgi:hypothetical protein
MPEHFAESFNFGVFMLMVGVAQLVSGVLL